MVLWFIFFLAYYPAICAYDVFNQVTQITNRAYNTHHPLAHTLLIELCLTIGEKINNRTLGIAIYSIIQMTVMAIIFTYLVDLCSKILEKKKISKKKGRAIMIILSVICVFFPYNAYMSISVTKDVYYTLASLLCMFTGYWILVTKEINCLKYLVFTLSATVICIMRNNGKWIIIITIGMTLIFYLSGPQKECSKEMLKLVIGLTSSLLMGIFILNGTEKMLEAEPGDKREMLSVPIQQIARVMVIHEKSLSETEKELINDFILNEAYNLYNPYISDPVKRSTNTYVVRYRTAEFLDVYFSLLKKYPADMINAVLCTNAGYLNLLDTSHAYINFSEGKSGMGYVQTGWPKEVLSENGIFEESKLESIKLLLEEWAEGNSYLIIPLFRFIFMPGIYIWIWIFAIIFSFAYEKRENIIILSFVGSIFLTLLFGPTVQMRYIYPIMLVLLFFISVNVDGEKRICK